MDIKRFKVEYKYYFWNPDSSKNSGKDIFKHITSHMIFAYHYAKRDSSSNSRVYLGTSFGCRVSTVPDLWISVSN